MKRRLALAVPILLAGCVAPQAPAPPPSAPLPRPAPLVAPAPPADWRDRAYTVGDWSYARSDGLGTARYGAADAARLTLRCDPRSGQVRLLWAGVPAGTITVRTTYGDTARRAEPSAGGAQIILLARDPLLDQIAYSRGRFMLAAGGAELILPAWPELARVIEDCR